MTQKDRKHVILQKKSFMYTFSCGPAARKYMFFIGFSYNVRRKYSSTSNYITSTSMQLHTRDTNNIKDRLETH